MGDLPPPTTLCSVLGDRFLTNIGLQPNSLGVCLSNARIGGKNMETLADLGIFLAGIGFLLIGSGIMWFVSEYSK